MNFEDFGGPSTFFGVKVEDFGVVQHFLGWISRILGSFNIFWVESRRFWGRSTFFGLKFGDFGVVQHFLGWISRILGCLDFGEPLTFFGANLAGFSGGSLRILG